MQHDQASFPDRLRAYTMDLSSAFAQTGQSSLADTSELTQHLGSSALLPQPLQLLCGDTSKCTPPATAVAGENTQSKTSLFECMAFLLDCASPKILLILP